MNRSKTLNALLAIVLALSLIPIAPRPVRGDDGIRVPIEEMLEAGEYVEGEALAVVRGSAEPRTDASSEAIAEVDDRSVEMAMDSAAATGDEIAEECQLRAQADDVETYTVQHVADYERSTEQILRELYEDPNVIVAQPNYLNKTIASSEDEVSPEADGTEEMSVGSQSATNGTTGATTEWPDPTTEGPDSTTEESGLASEESGLEPAAESHGSLEPQLTSDPYAR